MKNYGVSSGKAGDRNDALIQNMTILFRLKNERE